ncbi:hypothetical protein [Methanosarcina sp. UBA5]|nr:hypothetical protein [Methanosarcina sp. UBA5]
MNKLLKVLKSRDKVLKSLKNRDKFLNGLKNRDKPGTYSLAGSRD